MRQDYFKQELEELSALGYKEYEYMASHADDTCEICKSLDGKHFPISEAVIGVNCPPMHKGCRCLIGGSSENYEEIISDIGKYHGHISNRQSIHFEVVLQQAQENQALYP